MPSRHHRGPSNPLSEIPNSAVTRLAEILSRPPQDGVSEPSQQWLARQEQTIAALSTKLGLRRNPGSSLAGFFGLDKFRKSSPCRYHASLHPGLLRWILEQLKFEVTTHTERFRIYRKGFREFCPDEINDFVDKISGIASLFMTSGEFIAYYGPDYPEDCLFRQVSSGCPACIVSAIGSRAELLVDLRANMIARSKRRTPRLLTLVDEWISCFGPERAPGMMAESDVLAEGLKQIRSFMSERRRARKQEGRSERKEKHRDESRHRGTRTDRGSDEAGTRHTPRPHSSGTGYNSPAPPTPTQQAITEDEWPRLWQTTDSGINSPSQQPPPTSDPFLDSDPLRNPELDTMLYEDPRDETPTPLGHSRRFEPSPEGSVDYGNFPPNTPSADSREGGPSSYPEYDEAAQSTNGYYYSPSAVPPPLNVRRETPPIPTNGDDDNRSWATCTVHTESESGNWDDTIPPILSAADKYKPHPLSRRQNRTPAEVTESLIARRRTKGKEPVRPPHLSTWTPPPHPPPSSLPPRPPSIGGFSVKPSSSVYSTDTRAPEPMATPTTGRGGASNYPRAGYADLESPDPSPSSTDSFVSAYIPPRRDWNASTPSRSRSCTRDGSRSRNGSPASSERTIRGGNNNNNINNNYNGGVSSNRSSANGRNGGGGGGDNGENIPYPFIDPFNQPRRRRGPPSESSRISPGGTTHRPAPLFSSNNGNRTSVNSRMTMDGDAASTVVPDDSISCADKRSIRSEGRQSRQDDPYRGEWDFIAGSTSQSTASRSPPQTVWSDLYRDR